MVGEVEADGERLARRRRRSPPRSDPPPPRPGPQPRRARPRARVPARQRRRGRRSRRRRAQFSLPGPGSRAHPHRRVALAEHADHGERRDAPRAWVLGRHVLDRHRQVGDVGLQHDRVRVLGHARVCPDLDLRPLGPGPASASATATLRFAGKSRAASRAVPAKTRTGSVRPSRSTPLASIPGAPISPAGRLPRGQPQRPDLALGRGPDGVESEQRPGRHRDSSAVSRRELEQLRMLEQGADAQDDDLFAGTQKRLGDLGEQVRRRALDHQVGDAARARRSA